jgi:signal transduction histidine kinase/CheY-like chemotaxis protein
MLPQPTYLKDILQPVPICSGRATVAAALKLLAQSGSDRLVVVDDWQHPLGWIDLHQLMSHPLVKHGVSPIQSASAGPSQAAETWPSFVSQAEHLRLTNLEPAAMMPIPTLPANQLVSEFFQALTSPPAPCYALVTERGEILGLLDWHLLLQTLTPHLPGRASRPLDLQQARRKRQSPSIPAWVRASLETPSLQAASLQSGSLQAGSLQAGSLQSTSLQSVPRPIPPDMSQAKEILRPWLELMQRLPLALMLQTESGQPIAHNQEWTSQLEAIADPLKLWQTVAQGLAHPRDPAVSESIELSLVEGSALVEGSDHCTCSCEQESGQQQVLHFLKIPLGKVQWDLEPKATLKPWTEPVSQAPFHLADFWVPPQSLQQLDETLWLVIAQDLTEQQHLAEELTARNVDLIHLNRLKDEFLACMSHELRTPLTAVLGLATLLKDQTLGALNPRQVRYAELIYRSGRHLMAMVNDILDLSRMETGQLELQATVINLQELCQKAFDQATQLRLLDGNVTPEDLAPERFTLELEVNLPTLVADEQRLRQMLVNLLSNALKFTDSQASLGLKVNRWGGWIALTVWDEGIGIPAAKQHLIFEKFQQLEDTRTRQFDGTGLGLAITQRLARLHGGEVSFTSQQGKGCQFTILLPPRPPQGTLELEDGSAYPNGRVSLTQSSSAAPGTMDGVGAGAIAAKSMSPTWDLNLALSQHGQIVLIVAAVPHLVESLHEQLTALGYRIVVARSGPEALEKARRIQPCLVLLNPVLPQLSGWDVLTLLKSNLDTRQIPVVLLGAKHSSEPQHSDGADGQLTLPIRTAELRHKLARWVLEPLARKGSQGDRPEPVERLTVLSLTTGSGELPIESLQLNQLLHQAGHRILEAEGLEQGELVARVWKPNVVILNGHHPDWPTYLADLNHLPGLAAMPWITLTARATQAANQLPGLVVFPCLFTHPQALQTGSGLLAQVLRIAAGHRRQVALLTVDLPALLGAALEANAEACPEGPERGPDSDPTAQELHALTQYLHQAGLRALEANRLEVTEQLLLSYTLDAVLLYWHGAIPDEIETQLEPLLKLLMTVRSEPQLSRPAILLMAPSGSIQTLLLPLVDRILPEEMAVEDWLQTIRWEVQKVVRAAGLKHSAEVVDADLEQRSHELIANELIANEPIPNGSIANEPIPNGSIPNGPVPVGQISTWTP